ncbi:MAG: redox-sensing transcriptional repressor Rex [Chloroflexota bacterium]|nr:redox-sensing transcriptional repressor Rex [Chloroflexota bacterium]
MSLDIPDVVIERLPQYLRSLRALKNRNIALVSSADLGIESGVTPAQIRKDLSYFGKFGKQGQGYNVKALTDDLTRILGLDQSWPVILAGVGRLGKAILTYPDFTPEGFFIVSAFDSDPVIVGTDVAEITIRPVEQINEYIKENNIRIAILAVPGESASDLIDQLVQSGIRAILNYAPITPKVPDNVQIQNIDPVHSLQTMTFHLSDITLDTNS